MDTALPKQHENEMNTTTVVSKVYLFLNTDDNSGSIEQMAMPYFSFTANVLFKVDWLIDLKLLWGRNPMEHEKKKKTYPKLFRKNSAGCKI